MKTVRPSNDVERALQALVGPDDEAIIEMSNRRLIVTAVPEYEIVAETEVAPYEPDAEEEEALAEALRDKRPPLTTAEVLDRLFKRANKGGQS